MTWFGAESPCEPPAWSPRGWPIGHRPLRLARETGGRAADHARVVDVARLDLETAPDALGARAAHAQDLDVVDPPFVDGQRQQALVEPARDLRFGIAVTVVGLLERPGDIGRRLGQRRSLAELEQPDDVLAREDGGPLDANLFEDWLWLRGGLLRDGVGHAEREKDQEPLHHGTGTSSSGLKFPSVSRKARTVRVPCASDTIRWNIDGSVSLARSVSEGPDGPVGCEW